MAKYQINEFHPDSIEDIAAAVRRLWAQFHNLEQIVRGLQAQFRPHHLRTGFTTTNSDYPEYPDSGCQFVVQFDDWAFPEQVDECEPIDTDQWPMKYVVARVYGGWWLPEDSQVIVVRIPGKKGRRWWILPVPDKLDKIEAITCFYPGAEEQECKLFVWDAEAGNYVDSTRTVLVSDPDYKNFLLPEERAYALRLIKDDGTEVYHLIGSYGIKDRLGQVSGDVACDGTGTATIYYHASDASCSKSQSDCSVTFCNDWGCARRIKDGEEVFLSFAERRWQVKPLPRCSKIIAALAAPLCPGQSAQLQGPYIYVDCCCSETPTTAANYFNHAALTGKIEITYNQEDDEWYVTDVVKEVEQFAVEESLTSKILRYGSCKIDAYVLKGAFETCWTAAWKTQITLVNRTLLASIGPIGSLAGSGAAVTCPGIGATATAVCLFDADDGQSAALAVPFTAVPVVTGNNEDSECANLEYKAVCVLAVESTATSVPFICGSDCVTSSSSGESSSGGMWLSVGYQSEPHAAPDWFLDFSQQAG